MNDPRAKRPAAGRSKLQPPSLHRRPFGVSRDRSDSPRRATNMPVVTIPVSGGCIRADRLRSGRRRGRPSRDEPGALSWGEPFGPWGCLPGPGQRAPHNMIVVPALGRLKRAAVVGSVAEFEFQRRAGHGRGAPPVS
jgi:hypothetical protein